jgi:ATP-dependent RNA helicase RhlE
MFFSATMPDEIIKLSDSLLTNPKKVEVTPISSTANTIEQKLYRVDKSNKKHLLNHILEDEKIESLLVFSRTKH